MQRFLAGLLLILSSAVSAQDVRITPNMAAATFTINGETFTISREQDQDNLLTGEFARTSRACPPFCVHPMSVAPGVETVAELEVINFLTGQVAAGRGLLIDSRVPEWFAKGAIPGAVNVPFSTLDEGNPYRIEILKALGARDTGAGLDFSGAFTLMLYCNGPWCDQSPRAIRSLLDAGYPAERIKYYRGGMQDWLMLGLTVTPPVGGG
ncbi:rhodanese-like domain-containing protein [Marivivens marinus]|uniref:rhodanese-like domain-containing protein n=1 Tax=Marivivens marinus TaxID=3110173 RepID=UPI003B846490